MYLNLDFLRVEIIILLVSLIYALYYFIGNIFSGFIKLKSIVGRKRVDSVEEIPKELKIKTDENEHAENYTKDSLSYEDKIIIADLLKKARVFIGSGDYERAKNYIVEWLSIDKFNTDLNLDLAKIYVNEKEFLKAEYIYKDLLLVHSDNILIMKKLWDLLANQEKYDLSLEIYKKAYDIDKDDLEVVNMLANLSYVIKDFIWAEIYLKEFLKEKPNDLENLLLLWNTYEKLGDYEDALESYKKALIMKPYENFEIKDKIHKLEIYLLEWKSKKIEVEVQNDFSHLKQEVEDYKQEKVLEEDDIKVEQEKLEIEQIIEEKFSQEIEEQEKSIKK